MPRFYITYPTGENKTIEKKSGRIGIGSADHSDITIRKEHSMGSTAILDINENGIFIIESSGRVYHNLRRPERGSLIEDGDVLRLGNVVIRIKLKDSKATSKKKRLLVIVAVFFIILLIALLSISVSKKRKSVLRKKRSTTMSLESIDKKIEKMEQKIEDLLAINQWDTALATLKLLEDIDPLNPKITEFKKRIEKGKRNEKLKRDADIKYDVGKDQEAYDLYMKIDKDSVYYYKSMNRIAELKERLSNKYRGEGLGYLRAGNYKKARDYLIKYVLLGNRDKSILNDIRYCEKQLRYKGIKVTPFKLKENRAPSKEHESIIKKLRLFYGESKLTDGIIKFYRGDMDEGIKIINRELSKNKDPQKTEEINKILMNLTFMKGKYNEAQSLILDEQLDRAFKLLQKIKDTEKKLFLGAESFATSELKKQLATGYFKAGDRAFKMKLYKTAFKAWERGYRLNKNNVNILKGLAKLEKIAENYLVEANQLAQTGRMEDARNRWKMVCKITKPDSELCRKAKENLNR